MEPTNPDRRYVLSGLGLIGVNAAAPPSIKDDQPTLSSSAGRRIESFGAIGDGHADDTHAFERALASLGAGEVLELTPGQSYRLTRSLVFRRPLAIIGGTKEHTRLRFADGGYANLGGRRAAIILPHEKTAAEGSARRTHFSGFTVEWVGRRNVEVDGILSTTPTYFHEVDVVAFPGDGFHVEAQSERIRGNANGSAFFNCSARANGGNGFAFHGNDANACILIGSRSFDNAGAGFYDRSLIGNTYIGGEVDGNRLGGFVSDRALPNRSVYIGCYAEPGQSYDLNSRNMVFAPLGYVDGHSGAMLRTLPSGEIFSRTAQVFADDEAIAGRPPGTVGSYFRLGVGGADLMHADGHRVRITKLLSKNYVDLLNGNVPVLRLPAGDIAANVAAVRPWLPNGMTIGESGQAGILGAGAAPPSSGAFATGAIWLNDEPRPGGILGWVCVAPGKWHGFGRIDAGSHR